MYNGGYARFYLLFETGLWQGIYAGGNRYPPRVIDTRRSVAVGEEFDCVRPEALDYFLEITGMSEQEFHEIMKKKRHEKIKDYELVVKKKHHKNTERIKPFAEYMIEKNINQPDPRERNE